MIVAIHQPQYLPWLGYLDKLDRVDLFIFLDNVQYKKNEWQNRNRVKTAQGWQWMTVPVLHEFPQRIDQVRINPAVNWRKKHLHTLALHYARSPFFRDYFGLFEELYAQEWSHLSPANLQSIELLRKAWGIPTRTILASELAASQDPTQRLIDLCQAVGGRTYLSGRDGANYMQLERFGEAGIEVVFQEFHHPIYSQRYGDFLPNLSAVDLLFNHGPQGLDLMRKERKGCERRAYWPSGPIRTTSSMAAGGR